jgi:hypothetical protein
LISSFFSFMRLNLLFYQNFASLVSAGYTKYKYLIIMILNLSFVSLCLWCKCFFVPVLSRLDLTAINNRNSSVCKGKNTTGGINLAF